MFLINTLLKSDPDAIGLLLHNQILFSQILENSVIIFLYFGIQALEIKKNLLKIVV